MTFITAVAEALFGLFCLFIVIQIWKIQKTVKWHPWAISGEYDCPSRVPGTSR